MNRLIIIDNRFDLAHKLPTSYRSFLNYIWQNYHDLEKIPKIKNLFNGHSQFYNLHDGLQMKFNYYNDFS